MKCLRVADCVPGKSRNRIAYPFNRNPKERRDENRSQAETPYNAKEEQTKESGEERDEQNGKQHEQICQPSRNVAVVRDPRIMDHRIRKPPACSVKENRSPQQAQQESLGGFVCRRCRQNQRHQTKPCQKRQVKIWK